MINPFFSKERARFFTFCREEPNSCPNLVYVVFSSEYFIILIYSLILSNKDSLKGRFFLTGTLGYFLYSYASYSFVAMYNNFFLIFVALMGLSFFGFIINVTSFNLESLKEIFSNLAHKKYLSYSTIIFGMAIGLMWLARLLPALSTGIPDGLEHYTTLPIQALDLGIIVPATIISGILLYREKTLGYLLNPIIIIKGITILMAIDAMVISLSLNGKPVSIGELVIFPLFTIIYIFNLQLITKEIK
ncbi:hypothetical protein [Marinilactibacillus psychrotolerans]|uniref:Uncharacterized protein n=1 Tax=Marinilactibacillus psychrotolerans TaxID=191770 RepID=A0ABW8UH94_9LACT|nr:hypothetical protein [Marinilactibacillus psychrotolerans]